MGAYTKLPTKFLSLKQFMLRQEVLKLYRDVIRTTREVDPTQRRDVISWARADIETNKNQANEEVIKVLIANGRQMLKELKNSVKKAS